MDEFRRRSVTGGRHGRTLRAMMVASGDWSAATDIYETEEALVVCIDVGGANPDRLSVVAEEQQLTVSGERDFPVPENVRAVHRLEIERGCFEKRISLPVPVEVAAATSLHQHGFLVITLPKLKSRGRVRITVR